MFGLGKRAQEPDRSPEMPSSRALLDVIAERLRQVQGEGFGAKHDDAHAGGEIARAAANYATAAAVCVGLGGKSYDGKPPSDPFDWPWDLAWWKPGAPRAMLVKAAALILAEIERLDRLEAK